ncbi:MAG: hypothetical protein P1U46_03640 [Patescibacteria group bacterium]|nr:hypothetical protein [Patescibacteria group bacterium]
MYFHCVIHTTGYDAEKESIFLLFKFIKEFDISTHQETQFHLYISTISELVFIHCQF